MPAPPELGDVSREIRIRKISSQVETKKTGSAHSNIRVTRKITVDLKRKEKGREAQGEAVRVGVSRIDTINMQSQVVGNNDFLEVTPERLPKPVFCLLCIETSRAVELRQKVPCALDRTGDKLGEKADEGEKGNRVPRRLQAALVESDIVGSTVRSAVWKTPSFQLGVFPVPTKPLLLQAGQANHILKPIPTIPIYRIAGQKDEQILELQSSVQLPVKDEDDGEKN